MKDAKKLSEVRYITKIKIMTKKVLFLFLMMACLANAQSTKKVLFIGNSYTSVNDLPLMVSSMATNSGDVLIYDSNLPGGSRFLNHVTNATTLSKINSNTWDYVVLQAQSQEAALSQTQMEQEVFPYATTLSNLVRQNNSCSQPLFYMTWGRQNGDPNNCPFIPWVCTYQGMDNVIKSSYLSMAENNLAELAPAGAVWRYLRDSNPSINLYSPDESHPSMEGSYAAACALYTMIFKKDPTVLTWNSTLSASVASTIRMAAKTIVFDEMATWDFTVNPAVAHFTENINGNAVTFDNTNAAYDSLVWDFGDGTTSVETNPMHTFIENGMYVVSLTVVKCGKSATMTKTLAISGDLHLNQWETKNALSVFPNPMTSALNVKLNDSYERIQIDIIDSRGTSVLTVQARNTALVKIDVSVLQSGFYIMKISADDRQFISKVIKN